MRKNLNRANSNLDITQCHVLIYNAKEQAIFKINIIIVLKYYVKKIDILF